MDDAAPQAFTERPATEPNPAPPMPSPLRALRDADGRRWLVYEWTAPEHSPYPGRRFLILDSASILRRLSDFPVGWQSLSDEELLGLL